jgi:hypothetical protein
MILAAAGEANPAISQPIRLVENPTVAKEPAAGHLLQRLPSFATAATLAMLLAMTIANSNLNPKHQPVPECASIQKTRPGGIA